MLEKEIFQAFFVVKNCQNLGKGVIFVNGFNIGRFWENGPAVSLFVPKSILNEGINSIVVFETEGREITNLEFLDYPIFIEVPKKSV